MFTNWKSFISWEKSTKDTLDVKITYIDLVNDVMAGILLSQIVYWYLPSEKGSSKLRVKKDGHFWIAKSVADWHKEIRFTRKNYDTAIKKLIAEDLVFKERFKFDGAPTTHIRLNIPIFLAKLNKQMENSISALKEGEFDEFNTYLINQISDKPMVLLDLPESGKSNRPNRANGNDRIGQMEMTESGNSLTENTTENTTENINQSEAPEKLLNYVRKNKTKMTDRKINISDIFSIFEMNLTDSIETFISVLDRVIDSYKTNFKECLKSSLLREKNKIQEPTNKRTTRKEILPYWYKETEFNKDFKKALDEQSKPKLDASEIMDKKRALEERLKKYKK